MSATPPDADDVTAHRLALVATLVVLAAVLSVFYDLTTTFGGTPWLVLYVGLAFGAATLAARRTPTRLGVLTAAGVLALGLVGYALLLPSQYYSLFTVDAIVRDLSAWLTGRSVSLMLEADLWAVSVAPAPVFLGWYLAARGRYDAAALATGGVMGFFVLTGDLSEATTLLGVTGLLAVLGFGAVATSDGSWRQIQEVGLVVGLVLLLTRLVQVVPASSVGGLPGDDGPGGKPLEQTLLSNPDEMRIGGSPTLSPTPRFTIRAEQKAYWHARSFDHYGGQEWTRTDRALGAEQPLDPPGASGTTLQQSVTVESPVGSMPAAWKPVLPGSGALELADVGDAGNLEPRRALDTGTTYEVISEVPEWTEETLSSASTDYADAMLERYTQLPSDLPDRLVDKAEEIAGDAEGPYETALTIQRWLAREKNYSLGVERRNWDIADAFVFALDSGYCVYFATAMAVMLRAQGVPARFVVGYAPGDDAEEGWLVRAYHSHAWVEVYFEDVGWVTFDPTPSGPRQAAQESESQPTSTPTPAAEEFTPDSSTATPTPTATTTGNATNDTAANGSTATDPDGVPLPGEGAGNATLTATPTEEDGVLPGAIASGGDGTATATGSAGGAAGRDGRLWLVGALATLAFGSVRLGYAQSAVRSVWMRYQRSSDDPDRDVQRALDRMEYHIGRQFRPREDGETRQDYLADLEENAIGTLDGRAWTVVDRYQRSRYGDGVDRGTADDTIRIVNEMVR